MRDPITALPRPAIALGVLVLVIDLGTLVAAVGGQAGSLLASAALLSAVAWWLRATAARDPAASSARLLPIALCAYWALLPVRLVGYAFAPPIVALHALGLLVLLAAVARPPALSRLVLLAFGLGCVLRGLVITTTSLDPLRADMLPVVAAAITRMLAGKSPYAMYEMPSWQVPLSYLPGTVAPYVPAFLARVDLRWTNLVVEVLLALALWRRVRRGGSPFGLALYAFTFLDPQVVCWSTDSEHPMLWLWLALALLVVLDEARPGSILGAVLVGILLATSPLALIVLAFVGLLWLRQVGARAIALGALSVAVGGAILAPFIAWDPSAFFFGVLRWHNDNALYPGIKWNATRDWASELGVSGVFWARGLVAWLKPLQVLLVGSLLWSFWRAGATRLALGRFLVAALSGFVVLNPMVWSYLYWPAVIAGIAHLASDLPLPGERPRA